MRTAAAGIEPLVIGRILHAQFCTLFILFNLITPSPALAEDHIVLNKPKAVWTEADLPVPGSNSLDFSLETQKRKRKSVNLATGLPEL